VCIQKFLTTLKVTSILRTMMITFNLMNLLYFVIAILGIVALVYLILLIRDARTAVQEAVRVIQDLKMTNKRANRVIDEVESILKPISSSSDIGLLLGLVLPLLGSQLGPLLSSLIGGKKKQGGNKNG